MHVKPLVPLRSVRIPPLESGATMVAFSATFLGAAFMALAIISSSVGADLVPSPVASWCIAEAPSAGGSAAHVNPLNPTSAAAAQNTCMDLFIDVYSLVRSYLDVVSHVPLTGGYGKYASARQASIGWSLCEEQTSTPQKVPLRHRATLDAHNGLKIACQPALSPRFYRWRVTHSITTAHREPSSGPAHRWAPRAARSCHDYLPQ